MNLDQASTIVLVSYGSGEYGAHMCSGLDASFKLLKALEYIASIVLNDFDYSFSSL